MIIKCLERPSGRKEHYIFVKWDHATKDTFAYVFQISNYNYHTDYRGYIPLTHQQYKESKEVMVESNQDPHKFIQMVFTPSAVYF
jgi:hypothetical protein